MHEEFPYVKAGLVIILLVIIVFDLNYFSPMPEKETGSAVGHVGFTVCFPIYLTVPENITAMANTEFSIYINSTNPETRPLTFWTVPDALNVTEIEARNISMTQGYINFTPIAEDYGNYTIEIHVTDGYCSASEITNLQVIVYNEPPYLYSPIPNLTWDQGNMFVGLNMSKYFRDPDNDPMVFDAYQPDSIEITFDNDIATLTPDTSFYGVRYTIFNATDRWGAFAGSNIVKLTVEKVEYPEEEPPPSSSRGSSTKEQCRERWICEEWGPCIGGIQLRNCVDSNNCGTEKYKPAFQRECEVAEEKNDKKDDEGKNTDDEMIIPPEDIITAKIIPPWLQILMLMLIAIFIEFYTYYKHNIKKSSEKPLWPFAITLLLIFTAIYRYINYICTNPATCSALPWNFIVIGTISLFSLAILFRVRWLYIVNKIKMLKYRLKR